MWTLIIHIRLNDLVCICIWCRPGGGGGVVFTPKFGRYVPRQSEKWARAPERAPGRAWKSWAPEQAWAVLSLKMRGSGTSLIRFERENVNLRNGRPWEAMNPDERVEMKEILKMMVSGTAKSAQKCKMVMLRNGFFGNLWELYAPERKFRAENGGLSRGTYPICIHMEVPPPPRGGGGCRPTI